MSEQNNNEASPQSRPVTLADLLGKKVKLVSHGVEKIIHVTTDMGDGTVEVRKGGDDAPLSFEYFIVDSAIEPGVDVYVWLESQQSWRTVVWLNDDPWMVCLPGERSNRPDLVSYTMEYKPNEIAQWTYPVEYTIGVPASDDNKEQAEASQKPKMSREQWDAHAEQQRAILYGSQWSNEPKPTRQSLANFVGKYIKLVTDGVEKMLAVIRVEGDKVLVINTCPYKFSNLPFLLNAQIEPGTDLYLWDGDDWILVVDGIDGAGNLYPENPWVGVDFGSYTHAEIDETALAPIAVIAKYPGVKEPQILSWNEMPDGEHPVYLRDWRDTACCMGVGDGNGQLFVYGDYESIKAAQKIVLERDELRYLSEMQHKQIEVLLDQMKDAHMAGQADAGIDPSYYNAKVYAARYAPPEATHVDVDGQQIPIDNDDEPTVEKLAARIEKEMLAEFGCSNIPARPFSCEPDKSCPPPTVEYNNPPQTAFKWQRRAEAALFIGTIAMCLVGIVMCIVVEIWKA